MSFVRRGHEAFESKGRVYEVTWAVFLSCMAHKLAGIMLHSCARTYDFLVTLLELDLLSSCLSLLFWIGPTTDPRRTCQMMPRKGIDLFNLNVDMFSEVANADWNGRKLSCMYVLDSEALFSGTPQQRKRRQSRLAQVRRQFASMIDVVESLGIDSVDVVVDPNKTHCELPGTVGSAGRCGAGSATKLPLYLPSTIYNYHALKPHSSILPLELAATQYEPEISGHVCRLLEDRIAVLEVRSLGLWLPAIPEKA